MPRPPTTSPIGAGCSPRWPPRAFELLAEALAGARGHFADAALAYVRFALEHPGHYQVMFNKSLLDVADTELAAAEAAAGAELSRGVATLRDPNARADPAGAQLAAWSLVHGFSTLWLNDAVNARGAKQADPMDTVDADRDDAVRKIGRVSRPARRRVPGLVWLRPFHRQKRCRDDRQGQQCDGDHEHRRVGV